ncbi:MAG: NADPH-dependent FMN reductase [Sphingomicrobium sp.]
MSAIRIAALSGSLRAASINTARLREIASSVPSSHNVDFVPLGALPFFNPDIEVAPPAVVSAFRAKIGAADAIIIASPEYAHGVSGVLKNALDWLVGSADIVGKPVLVLNTAPQARHAIAALNEILATMSAQLVDGLPALLTALQLSKKGCTNAARN